MFGDDGRGTFRVASKEAAGAGVGNSGDVGGGGGGGGGQRGRLLLLLLLLAGGCWLRRAAHDPHEAVVGSLEALQVHKLL